MSTEVYLKHFMEATKKGPSVSLDDSDGGIGDFGQQKTEPLITQDFGDKYKLLKVDVNDLEDQIVFKSPKGPGTLNHSLMIYGRPGIGKSAIMRVAAMRIAREMGKEFIDFNFLLSKSEDELKDVFEHPEKYYVFIDVRAASIEAFDVPGIPTKNVKVAGTAKYLVKLWQKYLTSPGTAGLLFLDEFNQASTETQSAFFGLINFKERTIGERSVVNKDYWAIHAAGNLGSQHTGTSELQRALTNRFSIVYFEVTPTQWIKFAQTFTKASPEGEVKVVHPLILKFLSYVQNTYPDKLDKFFAYEDMVNTRSGDPNPRNFEKLSDSIYALQKQYQQKKEAGVKTDNFIQAIAQQAVADINLPWAEEFYQYLEIKQRNTVEKMLSQPEQYFTMKDTDNPRGVPKNEFFTNLSILQDRINGFIPEYLDAMGYQDYYKGKRNAMKDQTDGTLPKPPEDVDIEAYNKYALTFFKVIEALKNAKQAQHAAIILSYMRDSQYNGSSMWPIFQIALVNTMGKEGQQMVKTFLSTTAKELEATIKSAQGALNKMKKGGKSEDEESTARYIPTNTASYTAPSKGDSGNIANNLDVTNNILNKGIAFLDKLEPRLN